MTKERIAALIITSPIWLVGGLLLLAVFSPIVLIYGFAELCTYGVTGEWLNYWSTEEGNRNDTRPTL
jgi:hypothetical protein